MPLIDCFLSRTAFLRPDFSPVRAAQLRSCDGVLGPDGCVVHVTHASPRPRGPLSLVTLSTGDSELTVTADHRVTVRGPSGEPSDVAAGKLQVLQVFDGRRFRPVVGIAHHQEECHVVEVCFEGDERVLAWLPPAGRRRPATLDLGRAFAVRGCPPPRRRIAASTESPVETRVRNTFIEVVESGCRSHQALRRSRSAP